MLKDFKYKVVVFMKVGSHLYGTSTPKSDTDYKGVYIPSAEEILLQKVRPSIHLGSKVSGAGEKNSKDDVDIEMYSLQKYCQLLEKGDTNAVDMIFCPHENWVESSLEWIHLVQNKDRFLNSKIISFMHYCRVMADKYGDKGSRIASVKKVLAVLNQYLESGWSAHIRLHAVLPQLLDTLQNEEFISFGSESNGPELRYIEVNSRKFQETVKIGYVIDALNGILADYGPRALKASEVGGVDWKALSHSYRVCMEGIELFQTGQITLPLEGNVLETVCAIKQGKLHYHQVSGLIDTALLKLEEVSHTTLLPGESDHAWINKFVLDTYYRQLDFYQLPKETG